MNKLKSLLLKLLQFSAFKLGLIVTILFCFLARDYYLYRVSEQSQIKGLQSFLQQLHLKSIDYRMLLRGDRRGSKDVAILTVDEESLNKIGRWPFSRDVFAKIIDRTIELGAKFIAFDIIFSEKNITETVTTLNRLKEKKFKDPNVYQSIEDEIQRANTDSVLASVIEKHADHLILGTFYEPSSYFLQGVNESCANLIYTNRPAYSFIQSQELAVATTDIPEVSLPSDITAYLEMQLSSIALKASSQHHDLTEKQLEKVVLNEQLSYCAGWLYPSQDKSLPHFKEFLSSWLPQSKDYSKLTPEQFIDFLRYSFTSSHIVRAEHLVTNIQEYNDKTKHFGYFNAFLDKDGTIRRSNLIAKYGDIYFPSIALKTIMLLKNNAAIFTEQADPVSPQLTGIKDFQLLNLDSGEAVAQLPLDLTAALRINYAGPQKMFPHISVAELFNNKDTAVITMRNNGKEEKYTVKKAEWFKDKIFVLGATAVGIYDLRVTPFEENFPGVETHANVIDNLLRNDFLLDLPNEVEYMFYILLTIGILISLAMARLGAIHSSLFAAFAIVSTLYIDFEHFYKKGTVVNIILPLTLIVTLYIGLTIYKYFTEEKNKRELKGTFQKYVSPAIVEEVLKDAKNIELGGKKIRMSVLFSDVRGFTTISEKLDPKALGDFLNSYLTPMTELVFKNKGTLDKYMGDAVMAFFGAPIQYADHGKMACLCALDMMSKLDGLNKLYETQGLPPIDIGIGINTGEMSVGNMGSETVRSYTVMGDAVNLGSRLEGINKQYGTNIIISEFTNEDVKSVFVTREIDRVRVKGKLEPVKIFELVGAKNSFKNEQKLNVITIFNEGYALYSDGKFSEAAKTFENALKVIPDDGPSLLFLERAVAYIAEPPPAGWDGVFDMKTK
ncbi:MAG: adenylate/guanylate cyclase domain-containing protein [Bdellovibrionales bacterium]|nr:adenylate/guanylate cyclase domain-containing protein [Bdellovibrionales bacterium]